MNEHTTTDPIAPAKQEIMDDLRATELFKDVREFVSAEEMLGGYTCGEGPFSGMSFGGDEEC